MAWGFKGSANAHDITYSGPALGNRQTIYDLIQSLLGAGNWSHRQSYDGTTYGAATNQIGSASDLDNARAWIGLTRTDGAALFLQHVSGGGWRCKWVEAVDALADGVVAPGADNQLPAHTNELVFMGGGTDASPTGGATTWLDPLTDFDIVGCVDGADDGGFWFAALRETHRDLSYGAFLVSPIEIPDFPDYTDERPTAVWATHTQAGDHTWDYSAVWKAGVNRPRVWVAGGGSESWQLAPTHAPYTVTGGGTLREMTGLVNTSWGREHGWRVSQGYTGGWGGGDFGWKGMHRWLTFFGDRANSETGDTATYKEANDVLIVEDFLLPWDGTLRGTNRGGVVIWPLDGGAADAVAPTVTITPNGGQIEKNDTIQIEAADETELAAFLVWVVFDTNGTPELAWDGTKLRGAYSKSPSSVNGNTIKILRAGGWPSGPKVEVEAIDKGGNRA